MARGIALALGVVVVGLLVVGAPWRAGASSSQENRIALLEQQVANLQDRLRAFDLACTGGQIAAFASPGGAGPESVTLSWHPPAVDAPNDIFSSVSGSALLQGCTLTAAP